MSATGYVTAAAKAYRIVSPNGLTLEVTAEVFSAFEEALKAKKTTVIEIDIRMGGVAGVRMTKVLK